MSLTFNERLNRILPKLTSPDLLNSQGLGNEIGFWIFDYPPEEEMAMRAFLHDVVMPALGKHQPAIRAADVNLFDVVIALLEERKPSGMPSISTAMMSCMHSPRHSSKAMNPLPPGSTMHATPTRSISKVLPN